MASNGVEFNGDQQRRLRRIARSRSLSAGYVFRVKLILILAESTSFSIVKRRLQSTAPIISPFITRSMSTFTSDLARRLRRYINAYSANALPVRWKYLNPSRRTGSNELVATGY